MFYNSFKDMNLSALGFGCMRLPLVPGGTPGDIDQEKVDEMISYAMEHGVNYFDTAHPYHNGESEIVIGKSLNRFPRDSYYLADKYPGHQFADTYDPEALFEEQLKKCGVEYFDFYLLHNVHEQSIDVYLDPKWGIIPYFIKQRELGRIRHLGFSTHARPETLKRFLELWGKEMEFCQIQLNYIDWTLQDAETKVALLAEYDLPLIIMEPVRGGRLADLGREDNAALQAMCPDRSIASWAFRYLQGFPQIMVTLSGMSNLDQVKDNLATFEKREPLNEEELALVMQIAAKHQSTIPCTGCGYCLNRCPQKLDIPYLMKAYNDVTFQPNMNLSMQMEALPEKKRPTACCTCGSCEKVCPQNIEVSRVMKDLAKKIETLPKWSEICEERARIAKEKAQRQ